MKPRAILALGVAITAGPLSAQSDSQFRRVVTGISADGRAVVLHDGAPPEVISFDALPGFVLAPVWGTGPAPTLPGPGERPVFRRGDFVPDPGGTHFVLFTLPTPAELAAAAEVPGMGGT